MLHETPPVTTKNCRRELITVGFGKVTNVLDWWQVACLFVTDLPLLELLYVILLDEPRPQYITIESRAVNKRKLLNFALAYVANDGEMSNQKQIVCQFLLQTGISIANQMRAIHCLCLIYYFMLFNYSFS